MDNHTLKKKTIGFYNYIKINGFRNKDIVEATAFGKGNVSNYIKGKVNPSENFIITFEKVFNVKLEDFENVPDYIFPINDISVPHRVNTTPLDALNDLSRIKNNRRGENKNEGKIINDSDLISVDQYIIPLKGQAGLKKAFFAPDQYIEDHFEKEIIYVKPAERAMYHKIEVDGNSMTGTLEPGDWARCEDIPRDLWDNRDTFKPNKVYCLFHRKHGILFKRISNVLYGTITLSSDNINKIDYPDKDFDLMEFSKILIVRKVEKDL